LIEPDEFEQLLEIIRRCRSIGITPLILGAGSNVVFPDHELETPVIRLGRAFKYTEPLSAGRFRVGTSSALMSLSRELSNKGYSGLEFAGGIPATVGGAITMNAGAHSHEMVEVLES